MTAFIDGALRRARSGAFIDAKIPAVVGFVRLVISAAEGRERGDG
jgi:hypothetical protein